LPLQIVANSNFTNLYLRNNWKINNKNIITVHNGVQKINKISQKNVNEIRNQYKNQFIIGTTSRLAGFKRIDRLITAFQILYKKNSNVVLLIIGECIEKSSLKELVKNNDVRNVYFLGYKKNVHDYQSAFDICVFPSVNEPFGLVAVESYFINKPTLVFDDGGGLKEIVTMVNKNDIVKSEEELANRIQHYIDNQIKTVKNIKILNYFSAKRMEKDYFNCYVKEFYI
jgi:glycosyltransferase involved in cell wall biosynthesis